MARNVLKTNNTIVLVPILSSASAFQTTTTEANVYSVVQGSSFEVALPHDQLKQVGTQGLVGNELIAQPDINLQISYLPEPSFFNDKKTFFSVYPADSTAGYHNPSVLSGKLEQATNFYFLSYPDQGEDAQKTFTTSGSCASIDLNGWECMAFGNCYLTNYSLSYAVGELPEVSTSMICSNMKFEQITGKDLQSVAINLDSGNNKKVGNQEFYYQEAVFSPMILNPTSTGSVVTMENLQVGGQPLGGVHCIQSVSLDVSMDRVSAYGLGNDYAYNRKLQLPANGTVAVSSLVSGFEYGPNSLTGFISGILNNEESYDFEFLFKKTNSAGAAGVARYTVEDAKLAAYSYSTVVNDVMLFDASFTFEVTEEKGLRMSGASPS
jgi:hypothetical protein